jgi:hypothetical protein
VARLAKSGIIVLLIAGGAMAAVLAQPATQERTYAPDRQTMEVRTRATSTGSDKFVPIPGFDAMPILNRGPVTLTLSLVVSGDPIDVRVRQAGNTVGSGVAHVTPSSGRTSWSFTFVTKGRNEAACRTFRPEWRSPGGGPATIHHGSVVLTYRFDNTGKNGVQLACA